MPRRHRVLDQQARVAEKQASRDLDAERLASGRVTREQLKAEAGYFRDFTGLEIVAIGKRAVKVRR